MNKLPSEILLRIFSFVPWDERIKNLELVSKRWNHLLKYVANPSAFSTSFTTTIRITVGNYDSIECQLSCDNKLHVVEIQCPNNVRPQEMEELLTRIPAGRLEIIDGQFIISPYLKRFLQRHIRHLEMENLHNGMGLVKKLPALKSLTLSDMCFDITDLETNFLESLCFQNVAVNLMHLPTTIRSCPKLREIGMNSCFIMSHRLGMTELCNILNVHGTATNPMKLCACDCTFYNHSVDLPGCKITKTFSDGNLTVLCKWQNLRIILESNDIYEEETELILP